MQKVTISETGITFDYTDRETNPFCCEWAGFVIHDGEIKNPVILRVYKDPKKWRSASQNVSAWLFVWGDNGKHKNLHNVASCTILEGPNAEIMCLTKVLELSGVGLTKPIEEFLSLHTQLQDIIAAILSELYPDCTQFIHQAHA